VRRVPSSEIGGDGGGEDFIVTGKKPELRRRRGGVVRWRRGNLFHWSDWGGEERAWAGGGDLEARRPEVRGCLGDPSVSQGPIVSSSGGGCYVAGGGGEVV